MLHELLETLGNGRFAAADRTQQVEDLLLFFQALSCMPEISHHLFDHFFGAVEFLEGRIDLEHLVGEQTRQSRLVACVDFFRLANCHQHSLCCRCIHSRIVLAKTQIFFKRKFFFSGFVEATRKAAVDIHTTSVTSMRQQIEYVRYVLRIIDCSILSTWFPLTSMPSSTCVRYFQYYLSMPGMKNKFLVFILFLFYTMNVPHFCLYALLNCFHII